MNHWCKDCAMGNDCIGYQELKSFECCNFIPQRLDGSVNFDLIKENGKN